MPKLQKVHWALNVDNSPEIDFRAVEEAEYASFTGGDLSRFVSVVGSSSMAVIA